MHDNLMELMRSTGHLSGSNAVYVEELYEEFLVDPESVPDQWRELFESMPSTSDSNAKDVSHASIVRDFRARGKISRYAQVLSNDAIINSDHESKQVQVLQLISSYRVRGHQKASLDPLSLMYRERVADLELEFHDLSTLDHSTIFQTGSLFISQDKAPLKDIVDTLERIYCTSVGYEFMHIVNLDEKQWIEQRIESNDGRPVFEDDVKRHLLERLIAAEGLEKHLDSKYPGTKRFGLEGGESLIPALDELVQRSGTNGVKEIVLGMAHRGRLNVLVNILGKNPAELFDEFEGKAKYVRSGDVKYHQGFSSNIMTAGGEVHMALAFNPSHLEIVSPVVEGSVRARQVRRNDKEGKLVLPIIIHGDAAFAGQGVVMETFQMSQTRAYSTGGTVHIIINNQVGFTTSRQDDARSTEYCTDVARMIQAPIFHVNADDPEAVLFVTQLALDFRYKFRKDVVIDLICYRRRGHNETDEPSVTQPLMYAAIKQHKSTRVLYAEQLAAEGVMSIEDSDAFNSNYRNVLDNGEHVVKSLVKEPSVELFVDWSPYIGHDWSPFFNTSIPLNNLQALARKLVEVPEGFTLQRQVKRTTDDRAKMAAGEVPVDWGFAETLAYASILTSGNMVRITGQDVGRGTFTHRHAVLFDQKTGEAHIPLQSLKPGQSNFVIYDSLLSEAAVLAFEYGYSTTTPNALVIWEAQFGDFANSAQVVIDQFIASGEHKWERLCGLTLLLPHGYEGQGPEHSSARLERFLQLSAEHNIQVCLPTTSAQVFHMLRKQVLCPLRKPLIVMSPKSLLRHKESVSSMEEMAEGSFQVLLDETDEIDKSKARKLVVCSGKVYYDLRQERRAREIDDIAIIRLEQLYPFPQENFEDCVQQYKNVKSIVWCQEEPMNQGAWYSSQHHLRRALQQHFPEIYLEYVGRDASAAAAAGYPALHLSQQKKFIEEALS
ncbi:MAG: 2-oxoglutarate dehydrogenase E1 component [Gammaproteobacteria bacterium]|jgi:2-oxoglutarate dehydrogenase E1 component|nr:2-oxoglutarate dehydrogenase E1 component [Gammaproteobacteria bacterium]MBT3858870.1 2-oxoglutarate dehydrogenase E1 component [Gammaproteobacteria bacterium]MBT3986221.1 2-oxoglutarate dehydrogenase E1 component [Gammaproteobacteria bacterium]MBT4256233.1 2-oxoglutarate dehydrogenase E1 component [Gammaproteobacteria bacterium]MBT4582410.1 2-oxoglutarate dehydrogenase E1 component [Gammaproteobacteria bacterium]